MRTLGSDMCEITQHTLSMLDPTSPPYDMGVSIQRYEEDLSEGEGGHRSGQREYS